MLLSTAVRARDSYLHPIAITDFGLCALADMPGCSGLCPRSAAASRVPTILLIRRALCAKLLVA